MWFSATFHCYKRNTMQNHLLFLSVKHAEIRAWENLLPKDLLLHTASAVGLGGGITQRIAGEQKVLL